MLHLSGAEARPGACWGPQGARLKVTSLSAPYDGESFSLGKELFGAASLSDTVLVASRGETCSLLTRAEAKTQPGSFQLLPLPSLPKPQGPADIQKEGRAAQCILWGREQEALDRAFSKITLHIQ